MGCYNRGIECLLRGTDWVFKSDRYSFVLKGLILLSWEKTSSKAWETLDKAKTFQISGRTGQKILSHCFLRGGREVGLTTSLLSEGKTLPQPVIESCSPNPCTSLIMEVGTIRRYIQFIKHSSSYGDDSRSIGQDTSSLSIKTQVRYRVPNIFNTSANKVTYEL